MANHWMDRLIYLLQQCLNIEWNCSVFDCTNYRLFWWTSNIRHLVFYLFFATVFIYQFRIAKWNNCVLIISFSHYIGVQFEIKVWRHSFWFGIRYAEAMSNKLYGFSGIFFSLLSTRGRDSHLNGGYNLLTT